MILLSKLVSAFFSSERSSLEMARGHASRKAFSTGAAQRLYVSPGPLNLRQLSERRRRGRRSRRRRRRRRMRTRSTETDGAV
jgi:hypothetical protein